jgi:hypothetical protein
VRTDDALPADKHAVTLADAPALRPGPAPDQGAAQNVGWSSKDEAIRHGAAFIKKTYSKGETSIDNYEYGFDTISVKGPDGKTAYKWGTIYRGFHKVGDTCEGGGIFEFHTHTLQSEEARDGLRNGRWATVKSVRDYLLPTGIEDDMAGMGPNSSPRYFGNSDSLGHNRIWSFTEDSHGNLVTHEIPLP